MRNKPIPFALCVTIALALVAPAATAHTGVPVGDEYNVVIGWQTEPPIADQPNAVLIRVNGPPPDIGSDILDPGDIYQFTVRGMEPIAYYCSIHPWMRGNVTVDHSAPEAAHVQILDGDTQETYRYSPENVTINMGGTITWENHGQLKHNVIRVPSSEHGAQMEGGEHGGMEMHEAGGQAAEGGGHGGGATAPVSDIANDLSVTLRIAGKETTLSFRELRSEPGTYVADVMPTVPGVYNATFAGSIKGNALDIALDLQRVEPPSSIAFPEEPQTSFEVEQRFAKLESQLETVQAKLSTQAQTPATTEPQAGENPVPAPGALVLVGILAAAALFVRRIRRS